MTFGEPLFHFEVVGSTQDVARDRARQGATPGTTITSDTMTSGRGRQGRAWVVPPGCNVCLTAIGPPVTHARLWEVGIVAGAAVGEAVRRFAPDARGRFPNDVYLGGRKVSGVLVEAVVVPGAGGASSVVVPLIGVGVNVRRPGAPLPPEVAARAVSIEEAGGAVGVAVADVQEAVLRALDATWAAWEAGGLSAVLPLWMRAADLALPRNYVFDGQSVACRVADLSPDGALTLEAKTTGRTYRLHAAQVILGDD